MVKHPNTEKYGFMNMVQKVGMKLILLKRRITGGQESHLEKNYNGTKITNDTTLPGQGSFVLLGSIYCSKWNDICHIKNLSRLEGIY